MKYGNLNMKTNCTRSASYSCLKQCTHAVAVLLECMGRDIGLLSNRLFSLSVSTVAKCCWNVWIAMVASFQIVFDPYYQADITTMIFAPWSKRCKVTMG